MSKNYLDKSGLSYFWSKLKTILNGKANTSDLASKQDTLVSGTNIKTINGASVVGSGNLTVEGTPEVAISTTQPTGNETLWVNPNDVPSGSLNPITNEYSIATDKGYSCNYSNEHYGGVELWTNPHPDYEFDAQSVSIDLSNYKYIEIYYTRWQGTTLLYHKIPFEENSTIYSQLTYSDYDSGEVRSWNRVLTINNSGIGFNINQINGTTSNYGLIPYKIIGYK